MKTRLHLLTAGVLAFGAIPNPTAAAPLPRVATLNLLNGTGLPMTALYIRRVGSPNWQVLPARPSPAAKANIPFNDVECAFDLRATFDGGKEAVWNGVNLCETKLLTLNRNEAGATWADYD